jgi:integrase
MPASPQPRRRRRRVQATGTVRVAWRAKGPTWVMKYRLPDGTESMKVLGAAWVSRDSGDPRGWRPRRGRPPEGTLSQDAATAALRAFLDEQTERTPPERVSFARCAHRFLERCEAKNRSPNTLRTYRQIVAEVNERWDGWRIVDVDADELEEYRDELAERGLAASTINQRRAVLSGIFKLARQRFRVAVDPMDGFERAEVKAAGDLEVYSVEEVWALVRAAGSPTDAAIYLIAALCGLRRSEILGLRWRAVLFDQRALLLRRAYTEVGGDRLPKGQRVHSVPMAPQVYDALTRLAPAELDPDARVFPGEKAGAMDASALYRRYVKAQQRAGIQRLRLHDLRHTFGTQAIASGAHVMDVKDWMGHRHLSTTMRYVHHQPRHEAAERLGRHFSGAITELEALDGPAGEPRDVPPAEKTPRDGDPARLQPHRQDASSG